MLVVQVRPGRGTSMFEKRLGKIHVHNMQQAHALASSLLHLLFAFFVIKSGAILSHVAFCDDPTLFVLCIQVIGWRSCQSLPECPDSTNVSLVPAGCQLGPKLVRGRGLGQSGSPVQQLSECLDAILTARSVLSLHLSSRFVVGHIT